MYTDVYMYVSVRQHSVNSVSEQRSTLVARRTSGEAGEHQDKIHVNIPPLEGIVFSWIAESSSKLCQGVRY